MKEVAEVYAEQTINHIFTGKALLERYELTMSAHSITKSYNRGTGMRRKSIERNITAMHIGMNRETLIRFGEQDKNRTDRKNYT